MRHLLPIAGRELRSYFVSPVAYVVLVLFAVLVRVAWVGKAGLPRRAGGDSGCVRW